MQLEAAGGPETQIRYWTNILESSADSGSVASVALGHEGQDARQLDLRWRRRSLKIPIWFAKAFLGPRRPWIAHGCYFKNTKGRVQTMGKCIADRPCARYKQIPRGNGALKREKLRSGGNTSDPEHFSTAIKGTIYIWIYWTSTFKSWDSFSNTSQIGEKAGLSSAPISLLLLVFGFTSLASEPSRGIQKNLSFLKKRRG